jgi:hypothetical protein
MSQPQNQADVAQVLANALRTPGGAEREASFLQAVRNAPGTVKKSGVPRFETMEQVFSPTQMREVGDITRSLRREAEYSGLKANRGMVPEFMSPLEQMERQIPTVFSQGVTALRSALRNVGGRSDANVQRIIDEAMLDPRRMADLIDSVPPEARNQAMNSMRAAFNNPEILGGMVGTAVAQ